MGYAFGHPLAPDSGWWRGLLTAVASDELEETGHRTFALNEIMVRTPWRGSSVARSIHDELVRARPEERATLLVEQTHPKVRRRYGNRAAHGSQRSGPTCPTPRSLTLWCCRCRPETSPGPASGWGQSPATSAPVSSCQCPGNAWPPSGSAPQVIQSSASGLPVRVMPAEVPFPVAYRGQDS